eukprot:CAMPEP_0116136402 /NCGR_PEP_ID=MMETSP0329-20121206/11703_1 /TAXON_ID=697910 /ORGANISM="Pseudo-nitzschia arenysensis, Strain B593" /LENGTH=805 /DNA_ID=CAMNT_0003631263 /DNA_START=420 /DNA_END=2837 /DNA_ORIENTATION=-
MVSGRRVPSAGTASLRPMPPVSSKAKDYTDRPDEVVDELDDLRTRGIAKVLNKHFTTTTRKLALEKAEADSALADLERRRAQTKAFVPSKGGELNPYDKLYMQLQQKRAECRRKEKETMMLYQRYVMKYGKSAKAEPLGSGAEQEVGKDGGDPPGKSALGTLDENSEITFSKLYEKQREEQEQQKKESEEKAQNFMSAVTNFMTVSDDEQAKTQSNAVPVRSPSPVSSNGSVDPFMSAVSKFRTKATRDESNFESSILKEKEHDEDIRSSHDIMTRTPIESDLDNGIGAVVTPEIKRTPSKDPPAVDISADGIEVYEDESMISEQLEPITKVDPTPQKSFEKTLTVTTATEVLEEETKNIPVTPEVVPEAAALTLSPSSHNSTPKVTKALRVEAHESPYFQSATIDGFEFDDRSIISELTSANSAVTRQVMDEVETEMEDFIKFEMEAIKKMLDSEEDASTVDNSVRSETSSLMMADQSVHVAMKAEAMALEMQKILDDFAKEDESVDESTKSILNQSTHSSSQRNGTVAEPTSVYPYRFEPAIPGEDWYVHFDDNYQKEYYVEKNSNRTQWEYPQKVPTPRIEEAVSSDDFLSDVHSVASSRRSMSRRSSRRALYRKQRKRRRARRLAMSFVALLCVLVTVVYWRISHPDESVAGALAAFFIGLKNLSAKGLLSGMVDQFEYSFTDRKEREDLIRQQQETLAKIEQERKARDLADRKAKEEAARILKEAKEKAAREEAARVAARKNAGEGKANAKNKQVSADFTNRRHWGCNIPLAYVVPHCWKMAKKKPIFGLKSETDLVFLQ